MALLLKNYELVNGLVSNDAYVKIDTVAGNKTKIDLDIKVFISEDASNNGLPSIDQLFHSFIPDISDSSVNFIKQGYEYLKTLPKFSKAIDILE